MYERKREREREREREWVAILFHFIMWFDFMGVMKYDCSRYKSSHSFWKDEVFICLYDAYGIPNRHNTEHILWSEEYIIGRRLLLMSNIWFVIYNVQYVYACTKAYIHSSVLQGNVIGDLLHPLAMNGCFAVVKEDKDKNRFCTSILHGPISNLA